MRRMIDRVYFESISDIYPDIYTQDYYIVKEKFKQIDVDKIIEDLSFKNKMKEFTRTAKGPKITTEMLINKVKVKK